MTEFAKRLAGIEPFRVVEVLDRAKALEAGGRDIVHMEAGEPDFATAAPIVEAGRKALADGATHYSQACGIPELREAISAWYAKQYGLDISPRRIMVTPGASGALLLLSALLVNPGDAVLMADPGYPCNRNFFALMGGESQLVPASAEDRYQLTAALADAHWQDNSRGIIVASPANPTGEILSRQQLQDLCELSRRRKSWLIVDEIYHGLTYGCDADSVLSISDDAFVINSFSKYFGMTGWRLGWLVAPEAAVREMEKLAQNLFISMSTMAQYAALAAFQTPTLDILEQRRAEFGRRRDLLIEPLRNMGFGIPHTPAGALYLYADMGAFGDDSETFCLDLLEQHGVALTPGADFGHYLSSRHLRFAYTTGIERLEIGIERLSKVLG